MATVVLLDRADLDTVDARHAACTIDNDDVDVMWRWMADDRLTITGRLVSPAWVRRWRARVAHRPAVVLFDECHYRDVHDFIGVADRALCIGTPTGEPSGIREVCAKPSALRHGVDGCPARRQA